MYLKEKSTYLDFKIENTNDNIGINPDDNWCLVNIIIKNEEIDYSAYKKMLTKKELFSTIAKLKNLIGNNLIRTENLIFIKNYFSMKLYLDKENNKVLEIKMIGLTKIIPNLNNYTIKMVNDEIIQFVELLESQIN